MTDEFAKYAKTERRLNKLKDELSEIRKFLVTRTNQLHGIRAV